jgi:hypothetical protein
VEGEAEERYLAALERRRKTRAFDASEALAALEAALQTGA